MGGHSRCRNTYSPILEVYLGPLAVCDLAVVEHLQHYVEHVRVRLLSKKKSETC